MEFCSDTSPFAEGRQRPAERFMLEDYPPGNCVIHPETCLGNCYTGDCTRVS